MLGVGHGLGVKGREVLARGHWRAEALHACDGCLCHSLFNNVQSQTSYVIISDLHCTVLDSKFSAAFRWSLEECREIVGSC